MSPEKRRQTYWNPKDCESYWNPEGMEISLDLLDGEPRPKEAATHRLTFVMRILKRREWEKHDKTYTAFLRIIRYASEEGKPFFLINKRDIIWRPSGDLFGRFTYQAEGDPYSYSCDYTDLYPYPRKPDETYDPPLGLDLVARLNVHAYQSALAQLQRMQLSASEKKASFARARLLEYYDRIVDDFEEWVHRNYPEMPDCLQQVKSSKSTKLKPTRKKGVRLDKVCRDFADELKKRYDLFPGQVEVIRLLCVEYEKKGQDGMLSQKTIIAHLKEENICHSDHVRYIFRSRKRAYDDLIERIPKPKGHFRLKVCPRSFPHSQ